MRRCRRTRAVLWKRPSCRGSPTDRLASEAHVVEITAWRNQEAVFCLKPIQKHRLISERSRMPFIVVGIFRFSISFFLHRCVSQNIHPWLIISQFQQNTRPCLLFFCGPQRGLHEVSIDMNEKAISAVIGQEDDTCPMVEQFDFSCNLFKAILQITEKEKYGKIGNMAGRCQTNHKKGNRKI
jgi:hypothetical protein